MPALAPLAITMLLAFGASAWADDDAPSSNAAFRTGTAAFGEQDYRRALSHFQAARDRGLEGPAVHYNIAVCHYKLGNYQSARSTFTLIVDRYPAMRGLAQYNLGLVALRLGEDAQAAAFFRRALAGSEDETIRRLARRQLRDEHDAAAKRWLYLIDARLGHDDNVLLLADEISLPDGRSAESPFAEFLAVARGPLSDGSGLRFDGNVYAVRYSDAPIFDQTLLHMSVPYAWRWGAWRAEAGPHLSYTTLDGDTLEERVGLGAELRRGIASGTALRLRYVHDEVEEGEPSFAYLDGSRERLEARVDRRSPHGWLTLTYALESNDRAGPSVSPRRDQLSVRYRHLFDARWLGDIRLSWRDSRYGDLAEPRDEEHAELSLALTRSFARRWQLKADASIADNDSDVTTVAYGRNRVSVGFTKEF